MLALVRVFVFFTSILCYSVSMFTFSFIFLYFFCITYTLKLFYLVISAVICSLKINQSILNNSVVGWFVGRVDSHQAAGRCQQQLHEHDDRN